MLGVYSGVGAKRMASIQNGSKIYAEELEKLAKYLGCRMEDLWIREEEK
ncbi:helix-turn-helix domain-containing protein [Lacticaseibacillus pabuli]